MSVKGVPFLHVLGFEGGPPLFCFGCGDEVKLFLLSTPVCPNFFFFLFWCAGTSFQKPVFPALSSVGDCLRQFSRRSQLTAKRGFSWFMLHADPQAGLRSLCPLPSAQVGETPPGSFCVWCWIPPLPQMQFCLWIDAKVLLLGKGDKDEEDLMPCDADNTVSFSLQVLYLSMGKVPFYYF